jgi:hypothetical protein
MVLYPWLVDSSSPQEDNATEKPEKDDEIHIIR